MKKLSRLYRGILKKPIHLEYLEQDECYSNEKKFTNLSLFESETNSNHIENLKKTNCKKNNATEVFSKAILYKESFDFLENYKEEDYVYNKNIFTNFISKYIATNNNNDFNENSQKLNEVFNEIYKDRDNIKLDDFLEEINEYLNNPNFKDQPSNIFFEFITEVFRMLQDEAALKKFLTRETINRVLTNIYIIKNKIQTKIAKSIPLRFNITEYFDIKFTYHASGISKINHLEFNYYTIKYISKKNEKRFNKIVVFLN